MKYETYRHIFVHAAPTIDVVSLYLRFNGRNLLKTLMATSWTSFKISSNSELFDSFSTILCKQLKSPPSSLACQPKRSVGLFSFQITPRLDTHFCQVDERTPFSLVLFELAAAKGRLNGQAQGGGSMVAGAPSHLPERILLQEREI